MLGWRRASVPLVSSVCSRRWFASSRRRVEALQLLGLNERSAPSRESIRDAFYALAKQHHPDVKPDGLEFFKKLAAAFETLQRAETDGGGGADWGGWADGDGDDGFEMTGEAADPIAVFLRVEKERAAELRRELGAAAKLSSGGLDKEGLWALAEQMAAGLPDDGEASAAPATAIPRRRRSKRRRR